MIFFFPLTIIGITHTCSHLFLPQEVWLSKKNNLFSLEEYKKLQVRDRAHADLIEAATFQTIPFIHDKDNLIIWYLNNQPSIEINSVPLYFIYVSVKHVYYDDDEIILIISSLS